MDNVVDSFGRRLGLILAGTVREISLLFQWIFSSGLLNAKRAQNGGFRRPEEAPKHSFFKFFPSNVLRHDFNQFGCGFAASPRRDPLLAAGGAAMVYQWV